MNNKITFSQIDETHKNLLFLWFAKKHVTEYYYGDGLANTLENIKLSTEGINNNGSYTFYNWVAYINNNPFGFLMTSPIEGPYDSNDPYNKWYKDKQKIFTLDLLIGEEDFLGKGLSYKMIKEFIIQEYSSADYFLIDPEKDNPKAIHIYEKVGFVKQEEFVPSYNPIPHVMMRLDVNKLMP